MRIVATLFVILLTGCGYHPPEAAESWVGGETRVIYVELFDNQTTEPYLENFITEALIAELSRSRLIELTENPQAADARLVGVVNSFKSLASAYSSSDQITDYRASMKITARLQRTKNNELLWQDSLSRSENYLANANINQQLESERLIARQISERLAEDVYAQLLNNF
jgi:TolB-like protein